MNGNSYSTINSAVYKPSLTATISGSNWIFFGFCQLFSKRHLSGEWRVRAIRTHATEVARGVQRLALTAPLKWRVACKVLNTIRPRVRYFNCGK